MSVNPLYVVGTRVTFNGGQGYIIGHVKLPDGLKLMVASTASSPNPVVVLDLDEVTVVT